jgi:hypothetical protein
MLNYVVWTQHGERGDVMEDDEEEKRIIITFRTGLWGKLL